MRGEAGPRSGTSGEDAPEQAASDAAFTATWVHKPDLSEMHERTRAADSVAVLFVCMGNICRSPTAEGVFRRKVHEAGLEGRVHIDSAGTHGYHVGAPPDRRSQEAAAKRGYDLSPLRARLFQPDDCHRFDYVLAMDRGNYNRIVQTCRGTRHAHGFGRDGHANVSLFLEFAPHIREREVPDPYAGSDDGFEYVLDLIEAAAEGLLQDVRQRLARE